MWSCNLEGAWLRAFFRRLFDTYYVGWWETRRVTTTERGMLLSWGKYTVMTRYSNPVYRRPVFSRLARWIVCHVVMYVRRGEGLTSRRHVSSSPSYGLNTRLCKGGRNDQREDQRGFSVNLKVVSYQRMNDGMRSDSRSLICLTLTLSPSALIFPQLTASSGLAPASLPSNSCAVLTYTALSAPFRIKHALAM